MASEVLKRDQNRVTVLGAVTNDSAQEVRMLRVDPTTGAVMATTTMTDVVIKYLVASSTAPADTKAIADYVCTGASTGTTDDVQIIAAWNAAGASGAEVELSEGTFFLYNTVSTTSLITASNTAIRGQGRGITILKAMVNGISNIAAGTGDAGTGTIVSNLTFSDMTIDMNNKIGATYGMALGCCKDVLLDNIHIKNQKNGAKSMLFWGASTGASSAMVSRNLMVRNSIFSDSDAAWEAITLAQGLNVKFEGCTFRDKTAIYAFLNYGTHDVSVVSCNFLNCGNGINGFGNTEFVGCNFYNAGVTCQAYNTSFTGCSWDGPAVYSATNGLGFLGYQQSVGESFWDALPAGTNVQLKNCKVIGCTFNYANSVAIGAGIFTDNVAVNHLSCYDLEISDCSFATSNWQGIDVKAQYLTLDNNVSYNNGQLGTGSVKYNYVFAAQVGYISNNRSYDDQGSPTVTKDFFIDNQYSAGALATMDLTLIHNRFQIGGVPTYYTGSTFTTAQPANITLRGTNNQNINPDLLYVQGNVTGATTFTRVNGQVITATLTGNITVTTPSGNCIDDLMTWVLTQDATGSRTITLPSNVKAQQGGLTLSTTASAIDVITFFWDGTNWREQSRSMAVTGATWGAITGTLSNQTDLQTALDNRVLTTGGSTITSAAASNLVGLAITQNDTTNNPNGLTITQNSNGRALQITRTIAGGTNRGVVEISDTGASTNGSAQLLILSSSNASTTQDVLRILNSGSGNPINITGNAVTSANGFLMSTNGLTTGSAINISSSSTVGTGSNTSFMFKSARSGVNANNAHTAYGISSTVTNTNATSGTNIAAYLSASGATTANYGLIVNAGTVGINTTTPTALLHIAAGTATASTAPLKFTTGTNTTTAEIGAMEYNNSHYLTNWKLVRYPLGGTIFDHFATVSNGTTVETDLYSDTTIANTLGINGDKLEAEYGGTFVSSATATREIKLYFGGTAIFDTGALTLSLSSAWTMYASIIRVSATVVRYMISFTTEGAALAAYTSVGELTGLTLSNTNVLKITGQAGGVGAASADVNAFMGTVAFYPAQ